MRVLGIVLVVWVIIGGIAGAQRHYYNGDPGCARVGTIIVTVLAGPLNYLGANPKVGCPHPSK
jgi:hypothetical protein